jgi:hypothetical protein
MEGCRVRLGTWLQNNHLLRFWADDKSTDGFLIGLAIIILACLSITSQNGIELSLDNLEQIVL